MTDEEAIAKQAIKAARILALKLGQRGWRDLVAGCWLGITTRPDAPLLSAAKWGLIDLWRMEGEGAAGGRKHQRAGRIREQLSDLDTEQIDGNCGPVGWECESEDVVLHLTASLTTRRREIIRAYFLTAGASVELLCRRYGLSKSGFRLNVQIGLRSLKIKLTEKTHGTEEHSEENVRPYDDRACGESNGCRAEDSGGMGRYGGAPRSSDSNGEGQEGSACDAPRPDRLLLSAWDSLGSWVRG
jgi:hypothetical protein